MDFFSLLDKQARQHNDKCAIFFRDTQVSFANLKDTSCRVANGLRSLGVKKSDKIAVFLPNNLEYIYSFLAAFFLRATCVPLDFMLTEEEVVNFINHSESKILITQEKKGLDLGLFRDKCPALEKIILCPETSLSVKGIVSWNELLKESSGFTKVDSDEKDPAAIFYTSGSTGHPKGVLLNYSHLANPIFTFDYYLHPTDKDILLCAGVPFSHLGGLDHLLLSWSTGMSLVLMDRFQPLEFLRHIEKFKVSIFCIVPSMYVVVLSLKEYDKFDLSSLRYAVVFGAPSSPVLLERFHKACPNAYLLNGWGMTETAAPNTYLPTGTSTREIPHTGHFPPGTEAKIVDDSGKAITGEGEGELLIKGNCVMVGYYKEPELTRQVLSQDGWLSTGDIVRRDSRGRYSIVGRKKEMIKVAGEIVFCPEVEEVIHRHPKVQEVAVIGVSDTLRGEVPKAFIVPKPSEALAEDELRQFCRQHLAHFKIPHYFEFKDTLPKNRVGKIDKEKLKVPA